MTRTRPNRAAFLRRRVVVGLALAAVTVVIVTLLVRTGDHGVRRVTGRRVVAVSRDHRVRAATLNVYAAARAVAPQAAGDLARVYVPSGLGDTVTVIDPATKQVVARVATGRGSTPQHVIPSFDLATLWVLLNKSDQVVPIDAHTGKVGAAIPVNDPYNMYFTPDGRSAIVVAELHARLDLRDAHTMALQQSIDVPGCRGLNHADYSADLRTMVLTCEFSGTIVKVDIAARRVVGTLALATRGDGSSPMTQMPDHSMTASMPQDVRLSPDGTRFYVADMLQGGLHVIDAVRFREIGFIPTGIGAHSITPSHDGTRLYIANRGSTRTRAAPHGAGSVSVIDAGSGHVLTTWPVPGGGSPDMGNLTADGHELWLSGRFDAEVYVFDTVTGALTARIRVPPGPHGLTVWPLAGRFSLGHTGNMR